MFPQEVAIAGRHIRTLATAADYKCGMVVTPDARYMVVSYVNKHKLHVYRIEADGALMLLHTFGGKGAEPEVPYLIASTAWARTSSARACDNVSLSLLYSVVVTALHARLAGILC